MYLHSYQAEERVMVAGDGENDVPLFEVCMYVCMYVCMPLRTYIFLFGVCMYVHTFMQTYTCFCRQRRRK
jgi:hypothetical protein